MGASIFLTFNLLLNSRVGRNVEEVVADWIVQGWRRFGLRLIIGLFWFFVDVFRRLVETVERLMYAVDEWLRFRAAKAGRPWSPRPRWGCCGSSWPMCCDLPSTCCIEPQFNPIKHFPVVTVGHKLLLAAYKSVRRHGCEPTGIGEHRGLGRHRSARHLVHSRHFRLPGVGTEGELAALCGQPPPDARVR